MLLPFVRLVSVASFVNALAHRLSLLPSTYIGTTSLPKLIPLTVLSFLKAYLSAWFGETDVGGKVIAMHGLPMFHIMGQYCVASTVRFSSLFAAVLCSDFMLRSR